MREPEAATRKSRDLVRMAVAKAALAEPLRTSMVPVIQKALVIGGGLAGMTAALAIADHGYEVCLVERSKRLGGNLRDLPKGFEDQDMTAVLNGLVAQLKANRLVTVHTGVTVSETLGFVGNFTSKLSNGREFKHGAAVIATGASENLPAEYLLGRDNRVLTQRALSRTIEAKRSPWKKAPSRVVMIQCVGSRNPEHPYCSRVCCTRAVKNAIRLKQISPDTEVTVLYRDIRTYGAREQYYQQARDLGVLFIRFDEQNPPVVTGGKSLSVAVRDPIVDADVRLQADLVVLSTGMVSNREENDRVAKLFKVPLNDDGFFLEAHAKLRPVEFATEGVFLAGLAHGPITTLLISETLKYSFGLL
jgi:heterodisulfide reductase subunit A